jgi:hypothetical protein
MSGSHGTGTWVCDAKVLIFDLSINFDTGGMRGLGKVEKVFLGNTKRMVM